MRGKLQGGSEEIRRIRNEAVALGMSPDAILIIVDAGEQMLYLTRGTAIERVYPVSTGKAGLGEKFDSNMTPRGFHRIANRYGGELPPGALFKDRKPVGIVLDDTDWRTDGDYEVLTRILRLRGMEACVNAGKGVDSYERLIYLHGTNQEQFCGVKPTSNGCVRMRNLDIVELYEITEDNETWCWIGIL